MKLKKIASLALAGIMAVSMLAGCNNGSSSSSSSEAPVATGMTGKVIAALDEDVTKKVTFNADSELQKVLDLVIENTAKNAVSGITNTSLTTLNPSLGATTVLTKVETSNTTSNGTDSKEETSVFVVNATGTNEDMVAEQLAYKISQLAVSGETNNKIADLPERSLPDANNDYQFNFKYTGGMAVASATEATSGTITYVAAFTITRTPAKVEY